MRSLILAAAVLLPATGVAADDPQVVLPKAPTAPEKLKLVSPVPEHCPSLAEHAARKRGKSLTPEKLTELPPADAYHAVYRVGADGCPDPILVGYQYRQNR